MKPTAIGSIPTKIWGFGLYGRRPRCKRNLTYQRSVRVRSYIAAFKCGRSAAEPEFPLYRRLEAVHRNKVNDVIAYTRIGAQSFRI
jgi:hypothetical protein